MLTYSREVDLVDCRSAFGMAGYLVGSAFAAAGVSSEFFPVEGEIPGEAYRAICGSEDIPGRPLIRKRLIENHELKFGPISPRRSRSYVNSCIAEIAEYRWGIPVAHMSAIDAWSKIAFCELKESKKSRAQGTFTDVSPGDLTK